MKPFLSLNLDSFSPTSLLYLPSRNSLIVGTREGALLSIDLDTRKVTVNNLSTQPIESLSSFKEDSFLACGEKIWILTSDLIKKFFFSPHLDNITRVSIDNNKLYSASEDCTVKVTDLSNNKPTKLYEHESPIISFDFCKIKQLLASFCSENMMIIYSLERKNSLKFSTETKIWCLRFTLNGLYLMAGDHEGNLTLYETSKFENYKIETNNAQNYQFKVFQLHESRIKDIVESFDGKFVATASFDMSVCVFQLEKVEEKKSFNHHEDWVRGLSFGPHHIYSCGDDRKILGFEIQEEKVKTSENNSKFFWLIVFIVVLLLALGFFYSVGIGNLYIDWINDVVNYSSSKAETKLIEEHQNQQKCENNPSQSTIHHNITEMMEINKTSRNDTKLDYKKNSNFLINYQILESESYFVIINTNIPFKTSSCESLSQNHEIELGRSISGIDVTSDFKIFFISAHINDGKHNALIILGKLKLNTEKKINFLDFLLCQSKLDDKIFNEKKNEDIPFTIDDIRLIYSKVFQKDSKALLIEKV